MSAADPWTAIEPGPAPNANPYAFGAQLRRLRTAARISVRELADRAGVAHSYVTDLEVGNRGHRPSLQVVARMAAALGEPPDVFHLYRLHVVATQAPELVDEAYAHLAALEAARREGSAA